MIILCLVGNSMFKGRSGRVGTCHCDASKYIRVEAMWEIEACKHQLRTYSHIRQSAINTKSF